MSLRRQNYSDLEYVVIDACSTDETREVLDRNSGFIAKTIIEPDDGQADAINKGINLTSGDIVGWLNSDDMLCPGALERVRTAFMKDTTLDVVCGYRLTLEAQGFVPWCHPPATAESVQAICHLAQETVFFRRSLFEKVGGLDRTLQYAMDYDLWIRFAKADARFGQIPHFQGIFRTHPSSKGSKLAEIRTREMRRIYAVHFGLSDSRATIEIENERVRQLPIHWRMRWQLLNRLQNTRLRHTSAFKNFSSLICRY